MKIEEFKKPLKHIKDQQLQFIVWIVVLVFIGLSGVWMPTLFTFLSDGHYSDIFIKNIVAGSFASFCIVILSDGLATTLTSIKAGINITSAGIRGFIGIISILLIIINVGILSSPGMTNNIITFKWIFFQMVILLLSIFTAIYLYCFRSNEWEKDISAETEAEEARMREMQRTAKTDKTDRDGVKI